MVTFSAAAVIAPDCPIVLPPVSVSVPPMAAPPMLSAEASVSEALSDPVVVRLAVANVLAALVSMIAPLVVVALSAAAWIAPDWPMPLAPVSVSVPPTVALTMVSAEPSVRDALSESACRKRGGAEGIAGIGQRDRAVGRGRVQRGRMDRARLADGAAARQGEVAADIGAREGECGGIIKRGVVRSAGCECGGREGVTGIGKRDRAIGRGDVKSRGMDRPGLTDSAATSQRQRAAHIGARDGQRRRIEERGIVRSGGCHRDGPKLLAVLVSVIAPRRW